MRRAQHAQERAVGAVAALDANTGEGGEGGGGHGCLDEGGGHVLKMQRRAVDRHRSSRARVPRA